MLDLENIYKYHAPSDAQVETYQELRDMALMLARMIQDECPNSREKSLAFTNLENAMFWANASIARNG